MEDESNNAPWNVVDGSGGRNETSSGVDDWEVDVLEPGVGPAASEVVRNNGGDSSDEEEEEETVVDLSFGELTTRTDETPDDGSRSEDFGRRANEVIRLVGVAHVLDVL